MNKKKILFVMAIFAFAFLLGNGAAAVVSECFTNTSQTKHNTMNWGLGFQKDGDPPVGNSSSEELKKNDAYYLGDTNNKVIYLTFDAGFDNGNADKILDALKKHNVSATFFVVGNMIETHPEIIKRMEAEGHIVGNHSYHHPDMTSLSTEKVKKELTDLEDLYKSVTGKDMIKVYRPPQGKYDDRTLQTAKEMGYKTFFWSLAYVDWYENDQPTKEEAFDKLLSRVHPGAVVLLHSTSKTNADIMDELLTKWEEMGYTFGKVTDISGR